MSLRDNIDKNNKYNVLSSNYSRLFSSQIFTSFISKQKTYDALYNKMTTQDDYCGTIEVTVYAAIEDNKVDFLSFPELVTEEFDCYSKKIYDYSEHDDFFTIGLTHDNFDGYLTVPVYLDELDYEITENYINDIAEDIDEGLFFTIVDIDCGRIHKEKYMPHNPMLQVLADSMRRPLDGLYFTLVLDFEIFGYTEGNSYEY